MSSFPSDLIGGDRGASDDNGGPGVDGTARAVAARSPLPSIFMPDRSTVDGQTRCRRCACVPRLLVDLVVHELQECVG